MSRLIGEVIQVQCNSQHKPTVIEWQGVCYSVTRIVRDYRYQISWWQGADRQINRDYYLLWTQLRLLMLIYHKRDSDVWILESVRN